MSDIVRPIDQCTVPTTRDHGLAPMATGSLAFDVTAAPAEMRHVMPGRRIAQTVIANARGFARPPTILVYHHLSATPDDLTDHLQVTTHPDTFRRHIAVFARDYDLIRPADLLGEMLPKRPLLITFDDAYRSVLDIGGPILRERGAESLFFVNPATVMQPYLPLDNLLCLAQHRLGLPRLAELLGVRTGRPRTLAQLMFGVFASRTLGQREGVRQALCAEMAISDTQIKAASGLFLSPADLTALATYGIHVGNHSMTHPFLRHLTAGELDIEIRHSRALLENLTGRSVSWFSTPYGDERDSNRAVVAATLASGHAGLFLVHGRLNRYRPADNQFYRVSPRNIPAHLLPISLGLLPVLRTLRHATRRT